MPLSPIALASEAVGYLREEADFNRSWTDGRRNQPDISPGYIARRIEIAEQRERWATAIEDIVNALVASKQ